MYGLIHNSIVRPTPQPIPGNWSIQIMQHPLLFGLAGHNYLVLRNQDNTITNELHGLATDNTTGKWKYIGNSSSDVLQVWEFNGPRDYIGEKNFPGIILREGSHDEVASLWNKALACKGPINDKKISYPPFGVNIRGETENSNSVAYTLSFCMGIADWRHLGLLTPGEKRNLLKIGESK